LLGQDGLELGQRVTYDRSPGLHAGPADRPGAAYQCPPPRGDALDLGFQREAQERPDHHDQPEHEDIVEGRRDRDGANQVGGDQDFLPFAWDQNQPTKYYGPGSLDRTFQLSVGGFLQIMQRGPTVAFGAHLTSPLATSLYMENQGRPGEIYFTDITGDGESGDPIAGYKLGTFGRGTSGGNINSVISAFNTKYAGTFSPAAQALIANGLFTAAQMKSLGAVIDSVAAAPAGQFSNPWFRAFDAKLAWPIKVRERLTIEPSIGFYNLFNFSNFGSVGGQLNGSDGSANGTTSTTGKEVLRRGIGTGVNTAGAARQIEWSLKVSF